MQSVINLQTTLMRNGCTTTGASQAIVSLVTHASMCRARADAPPGPFRAFVVEACRRTRKDRLMDALGDMDLCDWVTAERRAACEALFDLIMEGV